MSGRCGRHRPDGRRHFGSALTESVQAEGRPEVCTSGARGVDHSTLVASGEWRDGGVGVHSPNFGVCALGRVQPGGHFRRSSAGERARSAEKPGRGSGSRPIERPMGIPGPRSPHLHSTRVSDTCASGAHGVALLGPHFVAFSRGLRAARVRPPRSRASVASARCRPRIRSTIHPRRPPDGRGR